MKKRDSKNHSSEEEKETKNDKDKEQHQLSERVEILSTEDQKIKSIGEILSSDSSRHILKMLFNNSMTANQISQKTGISLPLVIYHLKKMQESNVVKVTNVGKNTKSHDMKFYTADKLAIVILPEQMSDHAKKSKSLFNSFSRIHRLATLGAASIVAWFSSQFIQKTKTFSGLPGREETETSTEPPAAEESQRAAAPEADISQFSEVPPTATAEPIFDILWSSITVLSVIVAGLIIEVILTRHQKNPRANIS